MVKPHRKGDEKGDPAQVQDAHVAFKRQEIEFLVHIRDTWLQRMTTQAQSNKCARVYARRLWLSGRTRRLAYIGSSFAAALRSVRDIQSSQENA